MAILRADKTYNWNGLTVNEYFLTLHNPNHIAMPSIAMPSIPLGITIHNTEAISVSSSTTPAEQYTRATVNGNMNDVRVHFYVDEFCAWQNLPFSLSGWHAADGGGNGNRKTIAIEVIGNSIKAEENAVKLAAYLLHKFGLTVENNLFTHTHWLNVKDGKKGTIDYLNTAHNSYKNCPIYIIPHWNDFKVKVKNSLNNLNGKTEATKELYRVRKTWEDANSQIGAYSVLENAKTACKEGYTVFDNNGKAVYSVAEKPVEKPIEKPAAPIESKPAPVEKIDVIYRVYGGKWYGEITNYNETNDNGYAGVEKTPITAVVAKSSKGTLKYRVHVKNGGWLSWINAYNINNWATGCAGTRTRQIDAIQFDLQDLPDYQVRYRVSTINSKNYLNWISGYNNNNDMGYSGIFGQAIDKLQIEIIKK